MRKVCADCGIKFEAKRAAAKFCGERCRKRAQRRPQQPSVPAPVREMPVRAGGDVYAATLAELERAERVDSAAGQAALALARRIDRGEAETGSGFAAVVREHRAALAEALKDVARAADPLDELRARRVRKLRTG